jgi:hypothetical protein
MKRNCWWDSQTTSVAAIGAPALSRAAAGEALGPLSGPESGAVMPPEKSFQPGRGGLGGGASDRGGACRVLSAGCEDIPLEVVCQATSASAAEAIPGLVARITPAEAVCGAPSTSDATTQAAKTATWRVRGDGGVAIRCSIGSTVTGRSPANSGESAAEGKGHPSAVSYSMDVPDDPRQAEKSEKRKTVPEFRRGCDRPARCLDGDDQPVADLRQRESHAN